MSRTLMFVLICFSVWWVAGPLFVLGAYAREVWKEKRARGDNH